jgi:hypothetical protein
MRGKAREINNLEFLRYDCWGKKATQVVGTSLCISEGKSFVVVWISQQRIPTAVQ